MYIICGQTTSVQHLMEEQEIILSGPSPGNANSSELDFPSVSGNSESFDNSIKGMGSVNSDTTVTLEEVKKSTPEGNDPRPNSSTKRKRKRKPITEERKLQEMERLRNY
ncbi:unnamed protein product, partial [Allacma fusca]